MIAVLFEVWPHEEGRQEYLDLAAALRERLEQVDGFVSVERFQSLTDPGKILSLSFFRDEEAVAEWRRVAAHRDAQARGRAAIFRDYRLRIASVVRDYGLRDREQAPTDTARSPSRTPSADSRPR
ncbi:MAG TPA: antibiotic biosynthesis monooxygenase [Polyangiaceae bacterium]|nr:antibiotic biosynthesis monooxygenase [Polyangiaceae bacterium]